MSRTLIYFMPKYVGVAEKLRDNYIAHNHKEVDIISEEEQDDIAYAREAIKTGYNQKSEASIRHNGGLNGGIDGGLAERIIDQISANNSVTVQEISVALGTPKRTIEREMKRLRDSKRITRVGGNRYGYWEIIG